MFFVFVFLFSCFNWPWTTSQNFAFDVTNFLLKPKQNFICWSGCLCFDRMVFNKFLFLEDFGFVDFKKFLIFFFFNWPRTTFQNLHLKISFVGLAEFLSELVFHNF